MTIHQLEALPVKLLIFSLAGIATLWAILVIVTSIKTVTASEEETDNGA